MKYIKILGLIIVCIMGLAYYFIIYDAYLPVKTLPMEKVVVATPELIKINKKSLSGVGTLEEIRLRDEDLECKISYENIDLVEGTYFVSKGNLRGDFLSDSPELDGKILSSVVINNSTLYFWSEIDEELYGVKTNVLKDRDLAFEKRNSIPFGVKLKYDCKKWEKVDRSLFIPPLDILFKDENALFESDMEYGTVYEEGQLMEF